MTDTNTAVDKGSHIENNVVMILRGSRERRMYCGMLMFRDLVIFSNKAGSLFRLADVHHVYTGLHTPFLCLCLL